MEALQRAPSRAAGAATVEVALLGPPRVHAAGQPLPLARRQLRALFYRLAAELQPVPREQLCFLLWPDLPEATARRNLSVLLSQLRYVLPSPALVRSQHELVSLDPARLQVDTLAFAAALTAAARSAARAPLEQVAASYAGPFLDGFSLPDNPEFEAWAAQERQHWERRYHDGLMTLIGGHAAAGAYAPAIAAAQRALAVDPLAEELHRWLMALYAALGDRSTALRQFERCVVALERELGVDPLPETRALYEAVRAGEVPLGLLREGATRQGAPAAPAAAEAPPAGASQPLPAPATPLIGRQPELAAIGALLADPQVRLLTLTGPGGSGKTRLALQAAQDSAGEFADGVIFVLLAALRDPALVLQAIGQACGLAQRDLPALAAHLRARRLLLLLDNCEHLLAAGPEVAELLAAAPGLRVLATSRAALNLHGEHTLAVLPLPLPDLAGLPPLAELADVPAMALLLARTRALNPGFQLTGENAAELAAICVRLDGLPLAIELAATRLRLLTPRDLLRRLDRRLSVLRSGPRDLLDRQQTLHATIDWSYRLLDTAQQIWFERCSVFVGGWTLAAAEGLHERLHWPAYGPPDPLDALAGLVDKSLVQVSTSDGTTRFGMLETIREFAAERLRERGGAETVGAAHAGYFLDLVEPWDMNAPEWLTNMARELDNLRAALRGHLGHADGVEPALRLGRMLGRFWYWRDWVSEGRWWLEQIVARSAGVRSEQRAQILSSAALLATVQGDTARAMRSTRRILSSARRSSC